MIDRNDSPVVVCGAHPALCRCISWAGHPEIDKIYWSEYICMPIKSGDLSSRNKQYFIECGLQLAQRVGLGRGIVVCKGNKIQAFCCGGFHDPVNRTPHFPTL